MLKIQSDEIVAIVLFFCQTFKLFFLLFLKKLMTIKTEINNRPKKKGLIPLPSCNVNDF